MSALLRRLGLLCVRRPYAVVAVWAFVVLAIGAGVLLEGRRTTNDITLPGTDFQRATDLLADEFPPQQNGQSPIVFHTARGKLTDAAAKRAVEAVAGAGRADGPCRQRHQPVLAGRKAAHERGREDGSGAGAARPERRAGHAGAGRRGHVRRRAGTPAGLQVEAGGVIGVRLSEITSRRSEVIGVAAGIVILAFTFGALVAAAMPIMVALVGLATGLGLIGLLGHVLDIPVVAPTLATMLGLGVGIDYALFIVFRYRDELHAGLSVKDAVARAMATSGSAVVFAGCTVIIALLALLVAQVPMLGAMGYASAIAVLAAVLTAITLLPAILALLGRRIDAGRLPGRHSSGAPAGDNVWARWAALVTRHPWLALSASLLVLVPLMLPTLSLRLGQEDMGVSSTATTQRRAFDLISAGLGPGANGRLLVAARFTPAAAPSAAYTTKRDEAERLKRRLEAGEPRLKADAAALAKRRAALESEQAGLQAQAAGLQVEKGSLQARASGLQTERSRLLAQGVAADRGEGAPDGRPAEAGGRGRDADRADRRAAAADRRLAGPGRDRRSAA